jgi:hypothetical protein
MVLGLGLSLVKKALDIQKRIRLIQDTPRSKSQTAAQGLTEFEGFAWPAEKYEMTTRDQEAVYHSIELQKQVSSGSGKNRRTEWVTVSKHEFNPDFYLCDGTGLILVRPQNAQFEMLIEETRSWRSLGSSERDLAMMVLPNPDGFLDMPSSGFLGGLFAGKYRIIEKSLLTGNPLYVSGDFKTTSDDQSTVHLTGLTRFYQMVYDANSKSLRNLKKILDKDGDGKISRQESLDGFSTAARVARTRSKAEGLPEKDFNVYGRLQHSEIHQLFIAGAHENDLVKNLRFKPALMLTGGAAAIALAVVGLFPKLDLPQSWTKLREPSSQAANVSNQSNPDPTLLHTECVSGHLNSCMRLLEDLKDFELEPAHIKYYKFRACQLGEVRYCK